MEPHVCKAQGLRANSAMVQSFVLLCPLHLTLVVAIDHSVRRQIWARAEDNIAPTEKNATFSQAALRRIKLDWEQNAGGLDRKII